MPQTMLRAAIRTFFILIACLQGAMAAAPALPEVRLIPGELYEETIHSLLGTVCTDDPATHGTPIDILHFTFFTEAQRGRSATRRLAQRLKDLKAKCPGLPIRIILEGRKDLGKPRGAATRNRKTAAFFEGSGIPVHFISGLTAEGVHGVTHAKAIRVGDVLVAGSTNLTNTSILENNEFNVMVRSKSIAGAFAVFTAQLLGHGESMRHVALDHGAVTFLTDDLFLQQALAIIDSAGPGDHLDVTTYFFAFRDERDEDAQRVFDAIVAAKGRGARVRLYLERNANQRVNQAITRANLSVAARFLEAGIDAFLDPEDKISHSKIIRLKKAEGQSVMAISSANIYRGDLRENHQVSFIIRDNALVDQLGDYLDQKLAYEATPFSEISGTAAAAPMLRFWLGYAQEGVSAGALIDQLNARLIPQTTAVGAGRGLTAYLPLVYGAGKPAVLPDEIALIAYENERSYNAIRVTPEGKKYGPLHFEPGLFARQTPSGLRSASVVATAYDGTLNPAGVQAVHLGPAALDWQRGYTVTRTLFLAPGATRDGVNEYVSALSANLGGLRGALVLIHESYVITMLNFESQGSATHALASGLAALDRERGLMALPQAITHRAVPATGEADIGAGDALSVQFDAARLPAKERMEPLLVAFRGGCVALLR